MKMTLRYRSVFTIARRYFIPNQRWTSSSIVNSKIGYQNNLKWISTSLSIGIGVFGTYFYYNYVKPSKNEKISHVQEDKQSIGSVLSANLKPGEKRFQNFASLEYEGEFFMTPNDFLDSIVRDNISKPKLNKKILAKSDVNKMLGNTPLVNQNIDTSLSQNPKLFRALGTEGLISYPEYLFLLSLITRPEHGLRVAFDLIDVGKENYILSQEFSQFVLMATRSKKLSSSKISEKATTLRTHFFGIDRNHRLKFEEFSLFVKSLQREVLLTEFYEFSRGLEVISEKDFAKLLLRYTNLSPEQQDTYFIRLEARLKEARVIKNSPLNSDLTFEKVEKFYNLLNHMDDFSFAFLLHPMSGNKLDKERFRRAAKVCLGGSELDDKIVDILFALFDEAGDCCLSYEEFFVVMKNRLHRKVRNSLDRKGWSAFKQCLKEERLKSAMIKSY